MNGAVLRRGKHLWSENSIKSSHKCTREIHTRAHCNPGKCIIVSLLTEWSSNTVSVPVISCTTNRESFELVFCLKYVYKYVLLYLRILLRLSWCLNSQMHTSLSVHFTYGMNEVGGQTCVVMAIWMALHFKDPDFFFQHYCDQYLEFHHVIFRFFFHWLHVYLLCLMCTNCTILLFFVFVKCSELYAASIMFL